MKANVTRLFISIMNYPDNIKAAFTRATIRRETVWDKIRLTIARKMR